MGIQHSIWTEKYRPKTLDHYVFSSENQQNTIKKWISERDIPHVMFSGPVGLAKQR